MNTNTSKKTKRNRNKGWEEVVKKDKLPVFNFSESSIYVKVAQRDGWPVIDI